MKYKLNNPCKVLSPVPWHTVNIYLVTMSLKIMLLLLLVIAFNNIHLLFNKWFLSTYARHCC